MLPSISRSLSDNRSRPLDLVRRAQTQYLGAVDPRLNTRTAAVKIATAG